MISTIYVEKAVCDHPRTQRILSRFSKAAVVFIERYGEVFNRRAQNFRLQKKKPALIIAEKHDGHVLPTPPGYGIGGTHNYYFSHLLNCVYDCRYCFLQGMYSSANYVLFINYEDFIDKINEIISKNKGEDLTFFSGYDCDSLALEKITGFAKYILPKIVKNKKTLFEFRTKSIQLEPFLKNKPYENIILAYSILPEMLSNKLDFKTPSVKKRIVAMKKISKLGWKIGLRFDPLIYHKDWKKNYYKLFQDIFDDLDIKSLHSISFGSLRFPNRMFKKIKKLYPEERLFSYNFDLRDNYVSFRKDLEEEMIKYCELIIKQYNNKIPIFSCKPY